MKNSREIAKMICMALEDKKGEDIKVIDIREVSVVADYFIVASGGNQNQLQAMQDEVGHKMHENHIEVKQIEGNRSSTWILMDYGDVIVHLFSKEDRLFYNLERIWQDGTVLEASQL